MDEIGNLLRAIKISIVVAIFLLKTSRVLKAIRLFKESLILLSNNTLEKKQELLKAVYIVVYYEMFKGYNVINDHTSAIECGEKLLVLLHDWGASHTEGEISFQMANLYQSQGRYDKAKELYVKALNVAMATGERGLEGACYVNLGTVFASLGEFVKAEEYLQKGLKISKEIGKKDQEAAAHLQLGRVFRSFGEYVKAEEYLQRGLKISKEIGDKNREAGAHITLGTMFHSLGEYVKAEEYTQKGLKISKEIGDKYKEVAAYINLGTMFRSLCEYVKAKEYLEKALKIKKEIGDKHGEAEAYRKLGAIFDSLGEYVKAEEYLQKAPKFSKEIGDKDGEAEAHLNLGSMFESRGEYVKAEEHLQKALKISKEIGNKDKETEAYGNLGSVFESRGENVKAEEYLQKALIISKETNDKHKEAAAHVNLGQVFQYLGEYVKAEEYVQKGLKISKEIGDKDKEAAAHTVLGTVFRSLGEYVKAEEYLQKGLKISKDIGGKDKGVAFHINLGSMFESRGEYVKAEEYLQEGLKISKEIGDKYKEATAHVNLGRMFESRGEYVKAEEYLQKGLKISKEIGAQEKEAVAYSNLGAVFHYQGQYLKAKDYHEKALKLSYKNRDNQLQFLSYLNLALAYLRLGEETNMPEVVANLSKSIKKCEEMRVFLRDKDHFKVCFFDEHVVPYKLLSELFCRTGKHADALYVVELGRARALEDMMSAQYSVKQQMSMDSHSWVGIEKILKRESNCVCLYIAYHGPYLFLWILKSNNAILFRQVNVNDYYSNKKGERMANEVFGDKTLRRFRILTEEQCENRTLFPSDINLVTQELSQEDSHAPSRLVEEDEDQDGSPLSLSQCYKMIITPVADLLDEPEIIVVPDRVLYKVPFAALEDENEKPLSETFRIRIAPSLTTLKLIQDSPADYHSQSGALIVGDPQVGHVIHKGRLQWISPLDFARKEAEMIGRLLGTQPLIGENATKQKVLDNIHSVSLIHFAAHGNAERGEIALAPSFPTNDYPTENDYLLTMAEISQLRLKAKLVVLSCCHSARGQIRSEGVVGIARAFLGSGARSVLAALWAIQDEATEQFMNRFYKHLVCGASASESLHQAMKWMRANGFPDMEQWAPFMLIGDDVTFDFGK